MVQQTKQTKRPHGGSQDAELAQHYRQIGSAAILGALASKMRQADKEKAEQPVRDRRAA